MRSRRQSEESASGSPEENNVMMNDDRLSCPTCFTPYTCEHDPYGTGDPMHVVYWANCNCQDTEDEEEDDDTDEEEMP